MDVGENGDAVVSDREYKRRIRAWTMYDWANSAFATTILAAVLPAYYSGVAGATLPSAAVATAYWTTTLSVSLIIVAILSPILGTIADVMRGKKKMLSIFVGIGVVGTGLLVAISTGDWVLASVFFIIGRVGFAGANVFYDSLLPHVARPEDQDSVSARGYAIGYLGGGLLLAVNVAMILFIGSEMGARLSFLSVAIWWAVFSIPIFRRVPEPPSATADLLPGRSVTIRSFARLGETLQNIRRYKELFKYLIAFLIYNDGIGTIISVAVIYGAELGFQDTELILAILLVQFVGIPFSLIFGKIPSSRANNRAVYLAFIVFNIIALPLGGIIGAKVLSADTVGAPPPEFTAIGAAVGEGSYGVDSGALTLPGTWSTTSQAEVAEATQGITDVAGGLAPIILGIGIVALLATWALARRRTGVPPGTTRWGLIGLGAGGVLALLIAALAQLVVLTGAEPISYSTSSDPGASYEFEYNGQVVDLTYSTGPDHGSWAVAVDGRPVLDDDHRRPIGQSPVRGTDPGRCRRTRGPHAAGDVAGRARRRCVEHRTGGGAAGGSREQPGHDPGGAPRSGVVRPCSVRPVWEGTLRADRHDDDHETFHHPGADRVFDRGRMGILPRRGHRVLVPGMDGGRGAGRVASTQSKLVRLDVTDLRQR